MKEYIKYFPTLNSANDYKIKDVPFVCGVEEVEQPIMTEEPAKKIQISGNTASLVDNTVTISGTWNTSLTNNYTRVIINGEVTLTGKTDCYSITFGNSGHLTINAGARLRIWQGGITNNDCTSVNYLTLKNGTSPDLSDMAEFLIHPDVTTNTQPLATFECYTICYGIPKTGAGTNYKWQTIGSPFVSVSSYASNYNDLNPKPTLLSSQTRIWSFFESYDAISNKWVGITRPADYVCFLGFQVSNNTQAGGITYIWTGLLYGNTNKSLTFYNGWNYYGNGYTARIDVYKIYSSLVNDNMTSELMYITESEIQQNYSRHPSSNDRYMNPLRRFIIKNSTGSDTTLTLNYKDLVWDASFELDELEANQAKGLMRSVPQVEPIVVTDEDSPLEMSNNAFAAGEGITDEPQQMR